MSRISGSGEVKYVYRLGSRVCMKPILFDSPQIRRKLEEMFDGLAREYHKTQDAKVKSQLESLSKHLAMTPPNEEEEPDCE